MSDLVCLPSCYRVDDQEEVARHILARPGLAKLLLEASHEIAIRFGSAGRQLRMGYGGDDEDRPNRLVVAVETDLEVEDAENRYTAFLREWWLKYIEVEHRVTLTIDYR